MLYRKYIISPQSILPKALPSDVFLTARELFLLVQERWYHDFSILGVPTRQMLGINRPNQKCKQKPIFRLIDSAISLCREKHASIKGVELFCADGFYSNYAISKGATEIYGVDIDNQAVEVA